MIVLKFGGTSVADAAVRLLHRKLLEPATVAAC